MSRLPKALMMGLLTGGLGLGFTPIGHYLEENVGLDLLFKLRGPREVPTDVVIVSINKSFADQLGHPEEPEKWPRSEHARLTEKLLEEGAAVIAFDVE